jgi:hypothetical protein
MALLSIEHDGLESRKWAWLNNRDAIGHHQHRSMPHPPEPPVKQMYESYPAIVEEPNMGGVEEHMREHPLLYQNQPTPDQMLVSNGKPRDWTVASYASSIHHTIGSGKSSEPSISSIDNQDQEFGNDGYSSNHGNYIPLAPVVPSVH